MKRVLFQVNHRQKMKSLTIFFQTIEIDLEFLFFSSLPNDNQREKIEIYFHYALFKNGWILNVFCSCLTVGLMDGWMVFFSLAKKCVSSPTGDTVVAWYWLICRCLFVEFTVHFTLLYVHIEHNRGYRYI